MIEKMKCDDGSFVDKFNKLDDEQKYLIIGIGVETMAKVDVLQQLGHQTLKGHCPYIQHSSPHLIDHVFLALNGNEKARDCVTEFAYSDYFKDTLHCMRDDIDVKMDGASND